MLYRQKFQFEPPKFVNGKLHRSGSGICDIDYQGGAEGNLVQDPAQSDVPYLALMFDFIPADRAKRANFDSSKGKKLFQSQYSTIA